MAESETFWVEPGCLPGMSVEETQDYLDRIAGGYLAQGNADVSEMFYTLSRHQISRPRPGPSRAEIEAWEQARGFRLPGTLREALGVQDGGYVRGADLFLNPLEEMKPLSEGEWDHLWESEENQEFGDPEKLVMLGSQTSVGGLLILDGNVEPEPRILFLWRDLGDEIRDEGIGSFDEMVERMRASEEDA